MELTQDFDERSSLFSYSQSFYLLGLNLVFFKTNTLRVVVSVGLPEFMLGEVSNARLVFCLFSGVIGVLGFITTEVHLLN